MAEILNDSTIMKVMSVPDPKSEYDTDKTIHNIIKKSIISFKNGKIEKILKQTGKTYIKTSKTINDIYDGLISNKFEITDGDDEFTVEADSELKNILKVDNIKEGVKSEIKNFYTNLKYVHRGVEKINENIRKIPKDEIDNIQKNTIKDSLFYKNFVENGEPNMVKINELKKNPRFEFYLTFMTKLFNESNDSKYHMKAGKRRKRRSGKKGKKTKKRVVGRKMKRKSRRRMRRKKRNTRKGRKGSRRR